MKMTLHQFVDAAIQFSKYKDYSVMSWGRTAKRNEHVGGVAISAHRIWMAVDGEYDMPLTDEEIQYLEKVSRGLGLLWKLNGPSRMSFHIEPLEYP